MQEFDTPLCVLAYGYGSDKCPQRKHNYTPYYYELFNPIKNDIKKVLEIGIGSAEDMSWLENPDYFTGASLRMWRDFFPNAQVYGYDIDPKAEFTDDRISTFIGNQNDLDKLDKLLQAIGTNIDIVIDDGSHKPNDQIATCKFLLPKLKRDTIYIIEDVAHGEIAESLSEFKCSVPKLKNRVSKDDRLMIVERIE